MIKTRYQRQVSSLSLYNHAPNSASSIKAVYNSIRKPNLCPLPVPSPKGSGPSTPKSDNSKNRTNTPISDMAIPGVNYEASFMNLKQFIIEEIPPIPDFSSSRFHAIFMRKINLCMQICSFNKGAGEEKAIETKTDSLQEFLHLFTRSTNPIDLMEDEDIDALFDMIKKNILRRIPSMHQKDLMLDDLPPLVDPQWPHIGICYQILNRLVLSLSQSPNLNLEFYEQMIQVARSPDQNERSQITQFFLNIINQNSANILPLLKRFAVILNDHSATSEDPFSVATILPVMCHIFFNSSVLPSQFFGLFLESILPLLSDRYLVYFAPSLTKIINFFVEESTGIASKVVNAIIRYWPLTKIAKQIIFINLLINALPRMSSKDIQAKIFRIFSIFAQCSKSQSEKVAIASFSFWTSMEMDRIIADNTKVILPIMIPAVTDVIRSHWCPLVRDNASFALSLMNKYDQRLVAELLQQKRSEAVYDNPELKKWVSIARTVSHVDRSMNLSLKLHEITQVFNVTQSTNSQSQVMMIKPVTRARSNSQRGPVILRPSLVASC